MRVYTYVTLMDVSRLTSVDIGPAYTPISNAQETLCTLSCCLTTWGSVKSVQLTRCAFTISPFPRSLEQKSVDSVGSTWAENGLPFLFRRACHSIPVFLEGKGSLRGRGGGSCYSFRDKRHSSISIFSLILSILFYLFFGHGMWHVGS